MRLESVSQPSDIVRRLSEAVETALPRPKRRPRRVVVPVRKCARLSILAVLSLTLNHCAAQSSDSLATTRSAAKSPAESLACLHVREGFRIELVAAEPDVQDPIAIAWGADGRLWVVEMGGYPETPRRGRIRFLEDKDRDGHYERSVVFLDGLSFPTGVLPWHKGILVTCAPDIIYAEDSTGDGRADRRRVVLTGFAEGNPQHRVNGLRFGLDNWIHCSNGDAGGTIGFVKQQPTTALPLREGKGNGEGSGESATINVADRSAIRAFGSRSEPRRRSPHRTLIHGHDFRFCPRLGEIQRLSGMSQFGRCRDDWGNWFGCDNLRPFWHVVLKDRYLDRNPMLRDPPTIEQVMVPSTGGVVYPLDQDQTRFNEPHRANRFTSACGVAVYRDNLFGSDYESSYFVCEPAHQLVRHETMARQGVSFITGQGEKPRTSEFLASHDRWFRPTQVRTGPDGALWVVDMYRQVIEHPEYMRHNHPQTMALRMGARHGRIYRVVPIDSDRRTIPRLDQMETTELVAALQTFNGPTRDTIQQQIVERGDRSAVPLLSQMLGESNRPQTRLAALGTLDGLGAATAERLLGALRDSHPAIRRHAVQISESLLGQDESLQQAVLQRVSDTDLSVRLQVACSLGEWPAGENSTESATIGEALAQLATENSDQPFIITATLSSSASHADTILRQILLLNDKSQSQVELIKTLLRGALFEKRDTAVAMTIGAIAKSSRDGYDNWQLDVLGSLLDAINNQGMSIAQWKAGGEPSLSDAIEQLGPMFTAARRVVRDGREPIERRVLATHMLGLGLDQQTQDRRRLASLLGPWSPLPIQEAAVETLVRIGFSNTPDLLLEKRREQEPSIRNQIMEAILSRTAWTHQLLDRIESQEILAATITGMSRGKLLHHPNSGIRRRAGRLLQTTDGNRQGVIDRYEAALHRVGSTDAGRVLFGKHCATCHRYRGAGSEVGPDLETLDDRSPRTLLTSILDPNRAIAPRYLQYHAETVDGRLHSGILKSSSGGSIRLIGPDERQQILSRANLEFFESSNLSLMPEDWEQLPLTQQDMADLIAYLRMGA